MPAKEARRYGCKSTHRDPLASTPPANSCWPTSRPRTRKSARSRNSPIAWRPLRAQARVAPASILWSLSINGSGAAILTSPFLPGAPVSGHWIIRDRVWLSILQSSEEIHDRYFAGIAAILDETDGVSLFAQAGLPSDRGLLPEASDRLFTILLPAPREEAELARLFLRLFPTQKEVERFFSLPADQLYVAIALLVPVDIPEAWEKPVVSLLDAFCLLGARVQGLAFPKNSVCAASLAPCSNLRFTGFPALAMNLSRPSGISKVLLQQRRPGNPWWPNAAPKWRPSSPTWTRAGLISISSMRSTSSKKASRSCNSSLARFWRNPASPRSSAASA